MSWQDVQAALEACAGLEAFLPQFSRHDKSNGDSAAPTSEQAHRAFGSTSVEDASTSPAVPPPGTGAGKRGVDDASSPDVPESKHVALGVAVRSQGKRPAPYEGSCATVMAAPPVLKSELISSLRVLLERGLPPAECGREWDSIVDVARYLGIVDWGLVFDGRLALELPDPLPMPPRAPALSPQELGELLRRVGTPSVALFSLCHALPIFCAARTAPKGRRMRGGDFVDLLRDSVTCEDLTALALNAYLAAKLAELSKEKFTQLLKATRLHETGRAGQLALQQLRTAFFGDNAVTIEEFWASAPPH